mmetsp:Transcript_22909/g.65054  ORF Transcript_22909/g.65054 Transcript_22909/m.65054 type:complete len:102 (+) Transcript_22909:275-580(+)
MLIYRNEACQSAELAQHRDEVLTQPTHLKEHMSAKLEPEQPDKLKRETEANVNVLDRPREAAKDELKPKQGWSERHERRTSQSQQLRRGQHGQIRMRDCSG